MCYILMREEVSVKMRDIKEDTKLCLEDLSQRFTKCCGSSNKEEEYEEQYYWHKVNDLNAHKTWNLNLLL